jgi:L-asparaginase
MPHVVVLATGGTISARRSDAGGALLATDGADRLVGGATVPAGVTVEAHDVLRVGSYNLTLRDLRTIADSVAAHLSRPDVDGIVITHGTDTLEETAILLDLVHADPRPVVLTGAQRSADVPDTDGPRNLADAVTVAADPQLRGCGVVVAFGGAVLAARGVRKSHTVDPAAFSGRSGPLATVLDGCVTVHALPHRPVVLEHPTAELDEVRVDVLLAYPGAQADLLLAAAGGGARGVVVAGTGVGNAPPGFAAAVSDLSRQGVVVGLSTRVTFGPVRPVYGDGGGSDLVAAGAVPLALPAVQGRIALALLLSTDLAPDQVAKQLGSLT